MTGGRYLSEKQHQEGLVAMLQDFSVPTGWPVNPIIDDLQEYWAEKQMLSNSDNTTT
jgi:hypothetical protein